MSLLEHFDEWYGTMAGGPDARDELVHRHLQVPIEIRSTSLLCMAGLREVAALLGVSADHLLVDLACGRGGYSLWLARETGARVVGVDFSKVAIDLTSSTVADFGVAADRAEFRVGTIEQTGLPDACADAVVCIDAIQFTDSVAGAAREMCRILRPGGRVVLTGWQAADLDDERVVARMRVDLHAELTAGGLVGVQVLARPEWHDVERQLFAEAAEADITRDPALADLRDEALRVLPMLEHTRRVLVTGEGVR